MMTDVIIWLHDEALRSSHPVFSHAPSNAKALFIWDDEYFKQLNYSVKRLVFIYETLCALPIDIIYSDTFTGLQLFNPSLIYIPSSNQPKLRQITEQLASKHRVCIIEDEVFVDIPLTVDFKRFFPYWKKAVDSASKPNGGSDA